MDDWKYEPTWERWPYKMNYEGDLIRHSYGTGNWTPARRGSHPGSHNHSKGTSKARRKMAAASRKINRTR